MIKEQKLSPASGGLVLVLCLAMFFGSFGAFAYGLHCPSITVFYVGLWYTGAILLCALVGRLIVPRLIRW